MNKLLIVVISSGVVLATSVSLLGANPDPIGPTVYPYMVAASNAPQVVKDSAMYVADGIDDNVEIQAAIDAGTLVQLSGGTFNLTTGLTLNHATTLEGQGHGGNPFNGTFGGTLLIQKANIDMITATSKAGFRVKDLAIRGGKGQYQGRGIVITGKPSSSDPVWRLDSIAVKHMAGHSVVLQDSGAGWITDSYLSDGDSTLLYINNSPDYVVSNTQIGPGWGAGTHGVEAHGNSIGAFTGLVIFNVERGFSLSTSAQISNSKVRDTRSYGIFSASGVSITGCIVANPNEDNLPLGSGIVINNQQKVIINGCRIEDTGGNMEYGIREIGTSDKNIFTSNVITGYTTASITTVGTGTLVANNTD